MDSVLAMHRLHFAFTITYHYLFPQLTMGLALLIVILKTMAPADRRGALQPRGALLGRDLRHQLRHGRGHRHPHGVPVRHQLGAFSKAAGGVIGQTLAMEGVFSFFLESTFLGLFLFGEKRLGPRGHWWAALLVFLGSWLSGYFIVATERLDAAPGRLPAGAGRRDPARELLGAAAESLGAVAVPAHHARARWSPAPSSWPPSAPSTC